MISRYFGYSWDSSSWQLNSSRLSSKMGQFRASQKCGSCILKTFGVSEKVHIISNFYNLNFNIIKNKVASKIYLINSPLKVSNFKRPCDKWCVDTLRKAYLPFRSTLHCRTDLAISRGLCAPCVPSSSLKGTSENWPGHEERLVCALCPVLQLKGDVWELTWPWGEACVHPVSRPPV